MTLLKDHEFAFKGIMMKSNRLTDALRTVLSDQVHVLHGAIREV